MIDFPAWGWQAIAGVAGGLAVAALIGFLRMNRAELRERHGIDTAFTPAPSIQTQLESRPGRLDQSSGFGHSGSASLAPPAKREFGSDHTAAGMTGATDIDHARTDDTLMRMLDRLREQNRSLTDQLREARTAATSAAPAAASPEPAQSLSGDLLSQTQRMQTAAQDMQQSHARELSLLMQVTLEQLDVLQQAHLNQCAVLHAEIDRLRTATGEGPPFHDAAASAAAAAHQTARNAVMASTRSV